MSAWASAVVAALTTVLYVVVILQEGSNPFWDVFPWVMIMLIGTFAALASALAPDRSVGRFSATAAAIILAVLGVVAIFSVGVGFLVAAILASLAAVTCRKSDRRAGPGGGTVSGLRSTGT